MITWTTPAIHTYFLFLEMLLRCFLHGAATLIAWIGWFAGIIVELRVQLEVTAQGHEVVQSHSSVIEQLQNQVHVKTNVQRELNRQACAISEIKGQLSSCKSNWHKEHNHQVQHKAKREMKSQKRAEMITTFDGLRDYYTSPYSQKQVGVHLHSHACHMNAHKLANFFMCHPALGSHA